MIEERVGDELWAQFFYSRPWHILAAHCSMIPSSLWWVLWDTVRDIVRTEIMAHQNGYNR